jgi:hypothetical protein
MMMKFSLKHGLGLLAGLFLSAAALASESVPIEDRDAFEKEYLACIMSGAKDGCVAAVFSGHLDQSFEKPEEFLKKIDTSLSNFVFGGSTIYKIHPLDRTMRAGIFDSRSYLVERSGGALAGFSVVFRKIEGEWYVFGISVDKSHAFVLRLLNLPTLPAE